MRQEGSASGTTAPAEGQMDLFSLAQALWRRKTWIIVPTVLAGVAAAIFVTIATPQYRAQTLVLIENRETAYNRPEVERGFADRAAPDLEAVQSEVQLAQSRDLVRAVVRDLKLAERPEFNPGSGVSPLSALLALVGISRDDSRMTFDERVLERFYDRLSVYQIERSRVIAIEFKSENPILAAEVSNKVAEQLLAFQRAAKQERMRQAAQWLAGEIDTLRKRVSEAEARAEEFRGKSNLYVGSNNTPLSAQQLAELNSQIAHARGQRADAETKARMIREMLKGGGPIESSDIVNSELIRRLNEQRITLQAQLAEQSSTLMDQHPRIRELRAQIADLEAQTRIEAAKLARTLENDAKVAAARVETLSINLDQMKKQASALGAEDVQLRALEREAKSQRDLLEDYLGRYRDVTARESPDAVPPDARVLSQAVPPPNPYFPRKVPIVLIAMLATAICASTLVVLSELMSGIPAARNVQPVSMPMPETVSAHPKSWIGAAAPSRAPDPGHEEKGAKLGAVADHAQSLGRGILVVTPSDPAAPGAELSLELARELGQRGGRVLLLNLDTETNALSSLLSDPRLPGFADLVFGVAHFGEVIHRDRPSRIHLIPVGRGIRDTASLLGSERLAVILGALSQTYDHVVAATPSLVSLEQASRLAKFARGTLVVATEGEENAGTAASDALAALGFANVAVVSVAPEALLPDRSSRVAA